MDHRRTIIRTSARVCIQTRAYGCAYKLRHSAMQVLWNNNTTPIRNGQILGKIYNVYSLLSPVSYRADLDCLQNKDLTDVTIGRVVSCAQFRRQLAGHACKTTASESSPDIIRHHPRLRVAQVPVCVCVCAHTHIPPLVLSFYCSGTSIS